MTTGTWVAVGPLVALGLSPFVLATVVWLAGEDITEGGDDGAL
jgi:hypothetical protein